MEGIAIPLMGRNVGRSCRSIGSGFFGHPLFTALINSASYPRRDFPIPYQDGAARRRAYFLRPYVIWAAHEGTEGGSANTKNTRQDLSKKFRSGDPIIARPPYSVAPRLTPLVGFLMFEIQRHLEFAKAKGDNRGAIFT